MQRSKGQKDQGNLILHIVRWVEYGKYSNVVEKNSEFLPERFFKKISAAQRQLRIKSIPSKEGRNVHKSKEFLEKKEARTSKKLGKEDQGY